jgi:hypothetical protein
VDVHMYSVDVGISSLIHDSLVRGSRAEVTKGMRHSRTQYLSSEIHSETSYWHVLLSVIVLLFLSFWQAFV